MVWVAKVVWGHGWRAEGYLASRGNPVTKACRHREVESVAVR